MYMHVMFSLNEIVTVRRIVTANLGKYKVSLMAMNNVVTF